MTLDNYLRDLLNGSEVANVNIVNDNATTCDANTGSNRSSSGIETIGKIGRAQSLYAIAPNGISSSSGGGRNGVDHQTSRWGSRRMNSDSTLGKPKRRGSAEIQSIDIWKCMQNERAMDTGLSLPSRDGRSSPIEGGSGCAAESGDRGSCDSAAEDQLKPSKSLESEDRHHNSDNTDGPIGQPRRRRSSRTLLASLGPMAPTRTNSGDISECNDDPPPRPRSTSISSENSGITTETGGSNSNSSEHNSSNNNSSTTSTGDQGGKITFPKRPQKKRLVRTPTPGHHKNVKLGDSINTVQISTDDDDGSSGIVTEDEDSVTDSSPQHPSDDSSDPALSPQSSPKLSREGIGGAIGTDYNKLKQLHHASSAGGTGGRPSSTAGIIPVGSHGTTSSQGFPKSLRELPYESGQLSPTPSDEEVVATATKTIER